MNDSLRTNVFVRYFPETIACACIYLAARQLKISLPEIPSQKISWWEVFRVSETSIRSICYDILRLYNRAKPKVLELETKLNELHEKRRLHLEKRQRQREMAVSSTTSGANASGNNNHSQPIEQTTQRLNAVLGGLIPGSNVVPSVEANSGASGGAGGRHSSSNEEKGNGQHSRERSRKHRSKRGHHER